MAKVAVAPTSANLTSLIGRRLSALQPAVLQELISDFFGTETGTWELRIQLATGLEVTPVEDASVEWPEDVTPYRTVATLTVQPQDSYSPERRVYADDELSFNPWHCLVEHQPLGSIQRVRRAVYADSSKDRHRYNATHEHEPRSVDDLPD